MINRITNTYVDVGRNDFSAIFFTDIPSVILTNSERFGQRNKSIFAFVVNPRTCCFPSLQQPAALPLCKSKMIWGRHSCRTYGRTAPALQFCAQCSWYGKNSATSNACSKGCTNISKSQKSTFITFLFTWKNSTIFDFLEPCV